MDGRGNGLSPAEEFATMFEGLDPRAQHNVLTHLFETAEHVRQNGDAEAAVQLCRDLMGTIELQTDHYFLKIQENSEPLERPGIELGQAIEQLARLSR